MTDTFDRLKSALADRYAIEHELGAGGMATVYLAEEAFGSEGGSEVGPEDLQGHLAVMPEVVGEVDRSHAAGTHFFYNGVAVR